MAHRFVIEIEVDVQDETTMRSLDPDFSVGPDGNLGMVHVPLEQALTLAFNTAWIERMRDLWTPDPARGFTVQMVGILPRRKTARGNYPQLPLLPFPGDGLNFDSPEFRDDPELRGE